jgi:protein involved in polysaccharide export with SLBB domain
LADFENVGPVGPAVDLERIVRARMRRGPYRVICGEVIELTMPTILQIVTAENPRVTGSALPYICRVGEGGTITLPVAGEIEAAGKTLAEIEAAIVDAYYPAYAVARPSVFAKILEYKTAKVSITGAVRAPGIYSLRSDQMSLVALLMEAGGIVENGAGTIRIVRASRAEPEKSAVDYTSFESAGLRLSFSQRAGSGMTGLLAVKRNGSVLLAKPVDVSNNIQRQAFSARLSMQEPEVSTVQMEQALCLLARQLEPGYNTGVSENGTILVQGTAGVGPPVRKVGGEAAERVREGSLKALKHERSLREEEVTKPPEDHNDDRAIVLPVKGLNIPFADVALNEGDSVIVEPLQVPVFSVVGLVNRPGNFPYPADVRYNLMQALAFAGGLDRDAEPRYATIYRLKADGTIASASFQIANVADGSQLTEALNVRVKPYDIVAVEHTQRTRTTAFLRGIFSVHVGAYAPVWR